MSSSEIIQFHNCYILRDHKIIKEDLWVHNKKIINPEPLFFVEKKSPNIQVDCRGAIISPGFIDLQINGGFGLDFSHNVDDVEAGVQKVAKGLLRYGVTSFCPTLITSPVQIYHKIIPKIKTQNGDKNGAGVLGIHLEGPFISRDKKGAHSVQHIKYIESGFQDILEVYGNLDNVSIVTVAPEVVKTGDIVEKFVKQGITVSLGHSSGNLADGERAMHAGANFITHLFNAMLPFHHRDPGLVGLLTTDSLPPGRSVYYGIISDGIHTHPAALRIAYRSNPEGLVLVTDAVSAMGLEAGTHYIGEQAVEIKGHKAIIAGTNTLCGSIATMDMCVRYFKNATGCNKIEALECATLHPAQVLGITSSKGTLDFGSDADFILLDQDLYVHATFISGECVWDDDNPETQCLYKRVQY